MNTTLIVDASMVYAASKAKLGHLSRADGYPTGAVFGLVRMIESEIKAAGADRVFLALECGGTARKRMIYEMYKSGREHSTAALVDADHATDINEWALFRGVHLAWSSGYEADDVIAEIWRIEREAEREVVILSRDHDFHALLDTDTELAWAGKRFTRLDFIEKHGFEPERYTLFLALAGDPTDSVPGIVPRKRAREIAMNIAEEGAVLVCDQAAFARNIELVTMGLDSEDTLTLRPGELDREVLYRCYERLEFKSLMKKIDELDELERMIG